MKKIFVVSAPSGAGKTTLVHALIKRCLPFIFLHRVVTYTSRTPREGEKEGRDYHFVTSSLFQEQMQKGFFLEWSGVYGNYYGTPADFFSQAPLACGVILIVDRRGALRVKSTYPQAVTIFIDVLGRDILERRLRLRGVANEQDLARRLVLAREEMEVEEQTRWHDYRILNDDLNKATEDFEKIIKKEMSFVIKNEELSRQI